MSSPAALTFCLLASAASIADCGGSGGGGGGGGDDNMDILYFGDSLAGETRPTVIERTEVSGRAQTEALTFGGMAICDFLASEDPDKLTPFPKPTAEQKFKARVRKVRPQLVILQFFGNDATTCMGNRKKGTDEYYLKYLKDILQATQEIEEGAASAGSPRPKILWVLQGPDKTYPDRTRRLNDAYTRMAMVKGDRVSDAGLTVSLAANPYEPGDRYGWTQYLPCTSSERGTPLCTHPQAFGGVTQLHRDGDTIHFCLAAAGPWEYGCGAPSPGAERYGRRIAEDANAWLGL